MRSIEEDKHGLMYRNLQNMIKSRGQIVNDESVYTEDTFNQLLLTHKYVTISATRPNTNIRGPANTHYVLIAAGSSIANRTLEFKKLISTIKIPKKTVVEIMIISESEHNTYIANFVKDYMREHPQVNISNYTYDLLIPNVIEHTLVPQHYIASETELQEYFKHTRSTPSNLPRILSTDPVAIWYDFRHGMIVGVKRLSDSAGITTIYRKCY